MPLKPRACRYGTTIWPTFEKNAADEPPAGVRQARRPMPRNAFAPVVHSQALCGLPFKGPRAQ
jgi:hypothetical protein